MKSIAGIFLGLLAASSLPLVAQAAVSHADLAGWWSADPVHAGETSHLALQFLEKDGKHEAHLSLPAIGALDINLGEVTIDGDSINTRGLAFPLTWNAEKRTLSGIVPEDAAPIYRIPVEFVRGAPFEAPPHDAWQAPRPRVKWTVDTGGAPVWAALERASDGTLYVGNENGVLHAVGRDGRVRWKFETGKPIRAQPRVVGAHVYLHSDSGFLYKLDRASGNEVWRARVDSGSEPRLPTNEKGTRWDRYGSSVVADRERVYVASRDRNLYALDQRTGQEAWRVGAGDIMTATPALYRDLVIFAAYDGKVSAVAARDGKPRWTFDAKLAVAGDVTVAGDRVLVGSRSYDLIALDAATGREQWRRYYWFSWIESPPAVYGGMVYTGSSDAVNVYARNLADGALQWKTAVPGYAWPRTAIDKEWLVAATVGGGPFPGPRAGALVGMDRATGTIRWIHLDPPDEERVKAGKAWGFGAAPVIAEGIAYAADLDGKLHAFELR
jgi:outer membrane protein assembly factor BamB